MSKNKLINLLPQEEFDASVLGRTLKWAMGSFRIIVIVTEMIVMAAFLSRFWLDAQNSDLSDSIKIASAQIQAQGDFEKEFRSTQKKLSIFKQITSMPLESSRLDIVASVIPSDLVLSLVTIQNSTMQLKGVAGSEINIAQFVSNLKNNKLVKSVELSSIGSSEQDQSIITFLINISF